MPPGVSAVEAREKLREWRVTVKPEYYQAIRKEFDDAEISILHLLREYECFLSE